MSIDTPSALSFILSNSSPFPISEVPGNAQTTSTNAASTSPLSQLNFFVPQPQLPNPQGPPLSSSSVTPVAHQPIDNVCETSTSPDVMPGGSIRSRSGCYTCRKRKVKCDEKRPSCNKCFTGKRDCIWPPDDPMEQRKNKPRRPKPEFSESPKPFIKPIQPIKRALAKSLTSSEPPTKRTFKLPFYAPDSFISSLAPPVSPKDRLEDLLVPDIKRGEMMLDPSFLQPYFPTVDERLVIRHYLSQTVHIIMAFENTARPWNPWISVHAPLAFSHLPGVSPAADALRAAMLAVGAVHLRYLSNPDDQEGVWRITRVARPKVLGLVRRALEGPDGKPRSVEKQEVELVLAALLSCTIASSLASDDSWHSLLTSVLSLISRLGGAQSLLKDAPRGHLSPCRFVLEQLAIRDVFGCMTTELAPSILRDAFTPWFFEAEGWSRDSREWESIERMFGISRGMVDLIARACTLISRVKEAGYRLEEHTLPGGTNIPNSFHLRLPQRISAKLPESSLRKSTSGEDHENHTTHSSEAEDGSEEAGGSESELKAAERVELEEAANGLMAELRVWDQACNFTPYHPRTQYGNIAYRHAIRIRLLRNVFSASSDDPRIDAAARAILEVAKEMLAQYGRITWLTWPILIAGFHIPKGDPARQSTIELLGEFGPYACFDNRAACRMMTAFWKFHEEDKHDLSPWEVANRINSRPFLD